MKFSEQWLREWVDPPLDTEALTEQLTRAGLEVEDAQAVAAGVSDVVVAEVTGVGAHPNADRLRVCEVRSGDSATHRVVCGAPNVRPGMRVALARVGATLPDGMKIKRSTIRGVESEGMLCSARELALGDDADGILALDEDAPLGESLCSYLGLDDVSIDIDLTPNRGDCLSIAGLAREIGVLNRQAVSVPACKPIAPSTDATFPITLEAPSDCPRYVGRIITRVDASAATPMWMRERLRRCGVRAISPVVDVTNYVMLELGQPMHAFDLATLDRGIRVRRARAGERLTLLDESELELDEKSLVIADESGSVALAGIMGGTGSAVSNATDTILLESAFFDAKTVAVESRRRGLYTDASHRFARGVDSQLQRRAVERATALLLGIVGGEAGPVLEALDTQHLPAAPQIRLRPPRIARVLGVSLPDGETADILQRLGMQVARDGEDYQVTPPPFRPDVSLEEDLIEELARVFGYDNVPEQMPRDHLTMPALPEADVPVQRMRDLLLARGYHEAITYSFVDAELQALMNPDHAALALANPISSELAVMRTQMWPGLVGAAIHNLNRQQTRVRLFESGLVFREGTPEPQQPMLGGIVGGPPAPEQWGLHAANADFFDVKSDVEALLSLGGCRDEFTFEVAEHRALHPAQSAKVLRAGECVGWVGALHPRIASGLKLSVPLLLFELSLAALRRAAVPKLQPLSRFPSVRRDISVAVGEAVAAQSIVDCVGQVGVDMLENLELFDVYRGEGVDSGQKSVALSLTFRASSRTLGDAEVDAAVTTILDSLAKHLGATLRG